MLAIKYQVHIWHVSPQVSCGDTCQYEWDLKNVVGTFATSKIFAYGEFDERNFRNPHPRL